MQIIKKLNKDLISYIIGISILLFLFVFFVSSTWIGYSVENQCKTAQEKYQGDCVEALMSLIEDNSSQYGKNSAIWALGQLGDKRALPFLKGYYTGHKNEGRTKWDEGISQYELSKAIKLLQSGINLTAFVWR